MTSMTSTASTGSASQGTDTAAPATPAGYAAGQVRRAELGEFLRSRRERITPEDAGLPPGTRRRTSGLRREEVALLAGVGVTWYTWLEQGRPINASTQVLDAVARTLRLDQPEREHLYRLADIPEATQPTDECQLLAPEIQQILDGLSGLPASVVNERFDLLAWNAAYALLFPGLVRAPKADRNTLWYSFTCPGCCHPYVNRDEQLGPVVATLRGAYGKHLGEPAWTGFVRRLESASPEFARMWAQHEVASPASHFKIFRHPRYRQLPMISSSLGVLGTPGTRMVVYTPADERCRKALESLLAGEGEGEHYRCWRAHQRAREQAAAAGLTAAGGA
ncbi:MAG TPA: helix-turn-helix transcriptional regulator [Streptosporangiaceae bacterium]